MFAPGRAWNRPGSVNKLFHLAAITVLLAGCTERKPKTLGQAFDGAPTAIVTVRAARNQEPSNAKALVVVRGKMVEKCPVAGCWFMLRDETGTIKVDTRNAGFVVVDVPIKSSMVVAGRLMTNGTERIIDATGLRY
jgi:uncharacterized protein YdeI (BOF family)